MMKKIFAFLLSLTFALCLAACGQADKPQSESAETPPAPESGIDAVSSKEQVFALDDGRYVIENFEEESDLPYILIQSGWFTIVMYDGLSYQPSGKIEKNENEVIMASIYRDEDYCWTFLLTGDNTLEFVAGKSKTPDDRVWANGTKFIPEQLFS